MRHPQVKAQEIRTPRFFHGIDLHRGRGLLSADSIFDFLEIAKRVHPAGMGGGRAGRHDPSHLGVLDLFLDLMHGSLSHAPADVMAGHETRVNRL